MDLADFDRAEFEARFERAQALMTAAGLDALLLTSEPNYRYLTGHSTQFWLSKSRPMLALVPREVEPILFVTVNQRAQAERTSWVEDVRAWAGFAREGVELVRDALRELSDGRTFVVGAELGDEQRLGVPYADFEWLREHSPGVEFADAAPLLWELRMVKSPAEIDYLRRSAQTTGRAYAEMFAGVRAGQTERDAYREFMIGLFRYGAERPGYVPVSSGAEHYGRRSGGPTDRVLQPGDLLWFDGGCLIRGYWADTSRLVAIERATDAQRRIYRSVMRVVNACLEQVRPGMTAGDLDRFAERALGDEGLPLHPVGRIGHGIGLDITEPPSLKRGDETVIRPGMVLTIEPAVVNEHGLFQIEEICAVTDSGHDLLTIPAPTELEVVG
jgi:Xaa-Pro dipeptidase